jgi:hypothetical protein
MNAREIAQKIGVSRRLISYRAKKESWPRKIKKARGGSYYDFDLRQLPVDIQKHFEPREVFTDRIAQFVRNNWDPAIHTPFVWFFIGFSVGFALVWVLMIINEVMR